MPKGRVLLDPPRNTFQTVSPKVDASEAELKLAAPVAPPKDSVIILPLAWQASICEARNWQFGNEEPGKFVSSDGLQVCYPTSTQSSKITTHLPHRQATYVSHVQGRKTAAAVEDIDKCQRNDVDRIILEWDSSTIVHVD